MSNRPTCDMTRREIYIESKVTAAAKGRGWRVRKMSYIGRRGCPDRFYFRDGQLVMIEFKDRNGALSPHQRQEIGWFRANGFTVHVVDTIEDGLAIFEALDARSE